MATGSGAAAETIVVEMTAKDVELQARIAKLEAQLDGLQKKGTQVGQEVATGASNIGTRYAQAARGIAGAAEQMARTGNVAGEAARSILTHGANMALMFGSGGAVVGAIGITTLAVVQLFTRARREMEETRRKFSSEIAEMVRAGDASGLVARAHALEYGDPVADIEGQRKDETAGAFFVRQRGTVAAQARRDELNRRIAAFSPQERAVIGENSDLIKERKEIIAALAVAEAQLATIVDKGALARAAAISADKAANEAERDAAEKRLRDIEEAKRKGEQLARDREQLQDNARQALAKLTTTLQDDLELQIEELQRTAERKFGKDIPDVILRQLAALRGQLEQAMVLEPLVQELDRVEEEIDPALERLKSGYATTALELHDQLGAMVNALQLEMATVEDGTEAYKRLETVLKRILTLRGKLAAGIADAGNGQQSENAELEERLRKAKELGRDFEGAARGALQLSEAFGILDENASRALQSIVQIAAAVPAAMVKFSPATALPILGGIAGLASSLFGDSPAEQARRRALEENSRAIRELSDKVGLLGSAFDSSGGELGRAGSEIDRIKGYGSFNLSRTYGGRILGLDPATFDFLSRIAKDLGLTFDGTAQSLLQLEKAIDAASGKLAEFSDNFAGVNEELDFERQVFGDKGPLDNLTKLLAKVGGSGGASSPALAAILKAGDPNTAEGRAAMRKILEQYAALMAAGGGAITDEMLGNLSGDEFRQAILQILEYLNQLDTGSGVDEGTGGYNVSRQITEVTGNRIAGLLSADVAFNERTAIAVETMLSAQRGLGPVLTPGFPGGGFGGGGTVYNVNIELVSPAGASQEFYRLDDATARRLVERLLPLIDAGLGQEVTRKRRSRGDNSFPA